MFYGQEVHPNNSKSLTSFTQIFVLVLLRRTILICMSGARSLGQGEDKVSTGQNTPTHAPLHPALSLQLMWRV